jgi:hypothetical protein
MSYQWLVIFSCSIFIAAIISWVRFKRIAPAFYPFIICIWLGSLNELVSVFFENLDWPTAPNNNIYVLLEALLLTVQLSRWRPFKGLSLLLVVLVLAWLADTLVFGSFFRISSYFRVLYSAIIVLLAIRVNNYLILTERGRLLKHPVFLSCLGLILFFTYKILVEAFWLYGLNASSGFRENVYAIMIWINLFANLIYALAVLWMPAKQRFTIPY